MNGETFKMEKTKLKEEEQLVSEMPVQNTTAPVPAQPAEVEAAMPTEQPEIPQATEEEPVISTPQEPVVPSDPFTPPAPGMIPSGWVKPEDLAAAIAQETGDTEVASTAEDATVTEEPVPEVPITADDATEEYTPEEQEVIQEYRKYKQNKIQEAEEEERVGVETVELSDEEDNLEDLEDEDILEDTEDVPDEEISEDDSGEDAVEIDDELMDAFNDFLQDLGTEEDISSASETFKTAANFLDTVAANVDDSEEEEVTEEEDFENEIGSDLPNPEPFVEEDSLESEEDVIEEPEESFNESTLKESHNMSADDLEDHLLSVLDPEDFLAELLKVMDYDTKKDLLETVALNFDVFEDGIEFEESKEKSTRVSCPAPKKVMEKIQYPAGSQPMAETETDDLIKTYESSQTAKRAAIKKYREAIFNTKNLKHKRVRESINNKPCSSAYRVALNQGTFKESKKPSSPNSWSSNRFIEKYEESNKLDFQQLLNNGVLG